MNWLFIILAAVIYYLGAEIIDHMHAKPKNAYYLGVLTTVVIVVVINMFGA